MIHQARKENKPLGKVSFKAKGSKRSIVAGTAVAGNSAASRSGRASRGGRFNKFQKKKGPKHSQDSLDKDLDNYMMKDADFAKSKLDNDLDEYMKDVVTAE